MSGDRPRVLHLIANLSVGGAEMHLLYLTEGLVRAGDFDVAVAYVRESPDEARSLVPDFKKLGVPLTDLEMTSLWDVRAAGRFQTLLRRFRPHLVHTHLFRANVVGIPMAWLNRVPTVASVHNVERHFLRPTGRWLYRGLFGRTDRVIAISDAVKRAIANDIHVPPEKIERVYYGMPFERATTASPADLGREFGWESGPYIVTVGRLTEQKGHRYLIEAMAEVCRSIPSARALIIGHDGGLRSDLEAMVRRLGLERNVTIAGYRDDIAELIAGADLFALPSLWEGFGLVLVEAMASGRAVVASAVDSIGEIVVDGETGLLVPPADPHALAGALLRALHDSEATRTMGEAGRERALTTFTVAEMVRRTQEVYAHVLGAHGTR